MIAGIGLFLCASGTFAYLQNEHATYQFKGGTDGDCPYGRLTTDAAGNLYGTTRLGGSNVSCTQYCGTVFPLTPPVTGGQWNENVLYRFTEGGDGGRNGTVFELAAPAMAGRILDVDNALRLYDL